MSVHTKFDKLLCRCGIAAVAIAVALPLLGLARNDRDDDIARVNSAAIVFHDIMAVPDKAIPDTVLHGAHCIVIIPGEKKFALGIGGDYGKGVASCRDAQAMWSAPFFVTLGGGSWGAQIGGSSSDIVMVFRDRHDLDGMLDTKLRIGAGAEAAAGPIGRNAEAGTNVEMAGILTYARSKGLFAGINLNGAVLEGDDSANQRMYGNVEKNPVLDGTVARPAWSDRLLTELNRNHVTR